MERSAGIRAGLGRRIAVAAVAALLLGGGAAALAATGGRSGPRPTRPALPPVVGFQTDRVVPDVPLLAADGTRTSLQAFRGKVVVLAPFLTLCHEVCPLTTGAFLDLERDVQAAGLGNGVVFVELTVDPWRDVPARLRAFARLTGVRFPFLTGTPANVRRLWSFFGVGYVRVPQGAHPDVDWWTNRPETYDVAHVDGLFLIDASGHERIFMEGMPDLGGRLGARLRNLLSSSGLANLRHPDGAWTLQEALADLDHVVGRVIPAR